MSQAGPAPSSPVPVCNWQAGQFVTGRVSRAGHLARGERGSRLPVPALCHWTTWLVWKRLPLPSWGTHVWNGGRVLGAYMCVGTCAPMHTCVCSCAHVYMLSHVCIHCELTRVYMLCTRVHAHSCVYTLCTRELTCVYMHCAHVYVLLCTCVHAHSCVCALCTHVYMLTRVYVHCAHVYVLLCTCMCSLVCVHTVHMCTCSLVWVHTVHTRVHAHSCVCALCTPVCAPVHTCTCSLVCVGALVLWSELPFLQHLLVQGKEPEGHPLTGASRTAGLHSQYSGRQASQRPWAERGGEGPREARACVRWEQQFCGSTGLGEAGREATLRWAGPEPPASWSWG